VRGFAALAAAVLVSVGFGVGVEAAAGRDLAVYSAFGSSFSATFPSRPARMTALLPHGGELVAWISHTGGGTYSIVAEQEPSVSVPAGEILARTQRVCAAGLFCGWVAYAPLTGSSADFAGEQASELSDTILGHGAHSGNRSIIDVSIELNGRSWAGEALGAPAARARRFFSSFQFVG
jgi:hypothetical protein